MSYIPDWRAVAIGGASYYDCMNGPEGVAHLDFVISRCWIYLLRAIGALTLVAEIRVLCNIGAACWLVHIRFNEGDLESFAIS